MSDSQDLEFPEKVRQFTVLESYLGRLVEDHLEKHLENPGDGLLVDIVRDLAHTYVDDIPPADAYLLLAIAVDAIAVKQFDEVEKIRQRP